MTACDFSRPATNWSSAPTATRRIRDGKCVASGYDLYKQDLDLDDHWEPWLHDYSNISNIMCSILRVFLSNQSAYLGFVATLCRLRAQPEPIDGSQLVPIDIPSGARRSICQGGMDMTKVLVLYYSAYGHIEAMANAVAEGAREAGAVVDIKRVPELVPEEVARKSYYKLDQSAPIAKVEDLADYDAVIVGTGTRFGRMSSQMANFLDQAGGLWMRGALHGKVGGAFTSTGTQHGGQETTLFSIITNLLHFGMVIVGLNYGYAGQMTLDEITGGSPYGATTIAGGDASRQPSANELQGARYQGRQIAETAKKLHG
jgi:NAD(P)H dehydrogenase (quinone)